MSLTARLLIKKLLEMEDLDSEVKVKIIEREPENNSAVCWKNIPIEMVQTEISKSIVISQSAINERDWIEL